MATPESPGWTARRLALQLTLATGAATVVYRLARPLTDRLRRRLRARSRRAAAPRDPSITLALFHGLHEGMTEAAVIHALGPHFREVNGSVTPRAQTRTLRWIAEDARADVHAVFQNGRLVAKAQRGLA